MELVSHVIPIVSRGGQEVLVMPIGDIQWSGRAPEVALGMLKRHIAWGVERGAHFLGMGDYIDFMSPSNRLRFTQSALYDSALKTIDDKAASLVEDLWLKALKPSKGRWLGLLEGHHFHEYRDGTTTDQELAKLLDAPFLGSCAFVRLVFQLRGSATRGNVVIWCHHGVGGGVTLGAPLNKLERLLASWDADIYLIGHHHKKVSGPIDRVEAVWRGNLTRPQLVHRTKIIACTGSFLKGYVPGERQGLVPRGGYVERKMLNPTALGGVLLKIRPRWLDKHNHTGWVPDMNVEL